MMINDGAKTWVAPEATGFDPYLPIVVVLNPSTKPAKVRVTFYARFGGAVMATQSKKIEPMSIWYFSSEGGFLWARVVSDVPVFPSGVHQPIVYPDGEPNPTYLPMTFYRAESAEIRIRPGDIKSGKVVPSPFGDRK